MDVPVLSHAEVDTEVRRELGRTWRAGLVMRTSAELAPLIEEVARLPFEAARHHRRATPNTGSHAKPYGGRWRREDDGASIEEMTRRMVGYVAGVAVPEPNALPSVAGHESVARSAHGRFN